MDTKRILLHLTHFYGNLRKMVQFILESNIKNKAPFAKYRDEVLETAYKKEYETLDANNVFKSKLMTHMMCFYKSIDVLLMMNRKTLHLDNSSIYESFEHNSDKDFLFLLTDSQDDSSKNPYTFINFWVSLNDPERDIIASYFDKMYWCGLKVLLDKNGTPQQNEDYLTEHGVDIHASYVMYEAKIDGKKIIIDSIITESINKNKYVTDKSGTVKTSLDIVDTLATTMKKHNITEQEIAQLLKMDNVELTKNIDPEALKNIFSGKSSQQELLASINPKMGVLYKTLQEDIIGKMKNNTYDRNQVIDLFISLLGEVCGDNKDLKNNRELQGFLAEFLEQLEKNSNSKNRQNIDDFKRIAKAIQGDAKVDMTTEEKEKAKKAVRHISRMLKNPKQYFSKTEVKHEKIKRKVFL